MGTETAVTPQTDVVGILKEIILDISQLKISPAEIKDNANIFEDCGIDSTAVVELILALEEKFSITIAEDEITLDLFQDLSNFARFIQEKTAPAGALSQAS
jgi:acyl carrier protein